MNELQQYLIAMINGQIKSSKKYGVDTGLVSDGYHTFNELYEHRNRLFIALCKEIYGNPAYQTGKEVYRKPIENGWFILGININKGEQISYHLPESMWHDTDFLRINPDDVEFDGHTSADVLERLKVL